MKKVRSYVWKIGISSLLMGAGTACGFTRSHTLEYTPNYNSTQLLVQKAADQVNQVKGVQHSVILSQGTDLVIGIEPKPGTNTQLLTRKIQQMIASQPFRQNVYVTANPSFYHRMQTINTMATNGPKRNFSLTVRDFILDIKQIPRTP